MLNLKQQNIDIDELWFSSKEIRKKLRLTACELMHLRLDGEITYIKQGNAFLYKDPAKLNQSS